MNKNSDELVFRNLWFLTVLCFIYSALLGRSIQQINFALAQKFLLKYFAPHRVNFFNRVSALLSV